MGKASASALAQGEVAQKVLPWALESVAVKAME